jgi:hypothetical protein
MKTEFHINNSLNKDNLSYRTCVSCKRVKNKVNFYNENSKFKICNTIKTRKYY